MGSCCCLSGKQRFKYRNPPPPWKCSSFSYTSMSSEFPIPRTVSPSPTIPAISAATDSFILRSHSMWVLICFHIMVITITILNINIFAASSVNGCHFPTPFGCHSSKEIMDYTDQFQPSEVQKIPVWERLQAPLSAVSAFWLLPPLEKSDWALQGVF